MPVRLFLLLIFLLGPAFAHAAWNVVKIDGRRYVPIADVAAFYRMARTSSDAKAFRLQSAVRVLEGRAGSSEVRINGVKYVTCFPLRSRDGSVHVSAMDVTKIIEPIMRPGKIKGAKPIRTVVLDAGHGGHDSGAVGTLGREKAFALDVALRARSLLMRAGFQVKMTRVSDVFIPLEQRAAFANRHPDAVFVSVHFNKSKGGGTGIETYALAPRGVPSMDEENLRYSDFKQNPGNVRDPENIALAAAIHSNMVRALRLPDRGIKRARFLVIRNVTIPGVLVEGGFVDNKFDARYIATADYRQRMAQAIADGVRAYTRTVTGAAPQPSSLVTVDASLAEEETGSVNPPDAGASPTPTPSPSPPPKVGEKTPVDGDAAKVKIAP